MAKQQPEVNYIRHLNAIMEKFANDERITPFHVSLYLALFGFWNRNRFRNPMHINRDEVMYYACIRSNKTYLGCIRELHQFGFIRYEPSFNSMQGTRVHLFTLDTAGKQLPMYDLCMEDTAANTGSTQLTSIYSKHNENNKNRVNGPPSKNEVLEFFEKEKIEKIEAEKFYNYFESNGWKVGGKTPMKDWQAAARNWILNMDRFNTNPKQGETPIPNHLHTPTDKNYGEPL